MKNEFKLYILGKSSAVPTKTTFPSSQLLQFHNQSFLIDCGEGCQIQLRRNQLGFSKIRHIFISHVHGDHFFGLFGLLSSMRLLGRKQILHIYSHPKLESIVKYVLSQGGAKVDFPMVFHKLNFKEKEKIFSTKQLDIYSFPMKHKIPVCGFLFQEKQAAQNIIEKQIEQHDMTYQEIRRVKQGADLVRNGKTIAENDKLTLHGHTMRSYAYCSDTAYYPHMVKDIKNVQYLYHEATFGDDNEGSPEAKFHSTARQAAMIAKQANAKKLFLGHFSTRYRNADELVAQAREVFPESYIANENDVICFE
ncbi:MAG: ribonuclease Z [Bacteroidales bacterium]